MTKQKITHSRLLELVRYDPETGIFTWAYNGHGPHVRVGKTTGCLVKTSGYVAIRLDDVLYRAHRLAWLYVTGEWPKDMIDHKDTNRSNNVWSNLRAATNGENMQNLAGLPAHNTSGLLGASWDASRGLWDARIAVNKKTTYLGRYKTKEEAHAAYVAAKRKLHSHGNL